MCKEIKNGNKTFFANFFEKTFDFFQKRLDKSDQK